MTTPVFSGVGVALATFFQDGGDLDAAATAEHAARIAGLGVRAVVIAGTTGEAASLSSAERVEILKAVRRAVPADIAVVAGTGAPSSQQAAALTRDAAEHGADAVLVLSPPGAQDVRPYYEQVAAAAGDVPVLAYHFPAVSPPGIPVEILAELPVVGVKDSTGDAARALHELEVLDGRALYVGDASILLQAGLVGATGAILAVANVDPERSLRAFAGDADAQRELATVDRRVSGAPFPQVLKEQIAERFGTSTVTRMG